MEDWIEIEGKSKDEAIERACIALNTTRSYLSYEVLSEGNTIKIRAQKVEKEQVSVAETNVGKEAQENLIAILQFIEEGTKVDLIENEDSVRLEIMGNGSGIFIGKHGQTLEALQHLVAKMSGLDHADRKHLIVDSEHYRERRQESLEMFARKMASRAKREGRPVSGEPMSAMDRRVIHMALANDPSVSTKSVGEGRNLKVLIVPKEGGRRPNGGSRRGSRSGGNGPRGAPRGDRERRPVPGARMHDSFDVPPEPEADIFEEEPDAPVMSHESEDAGMDDAQVESQEAEKSDDSI